MLDKTMQSLSSDHPSIRPTIHRPRLSQIEGSECKALESSERASKAEFSFLFQRKTPFTTLPCLPDAYAESTTNACQNGSKEER